MFDRSGPYGPFPYACVTFADTETTGLFPYGVNDDGQPSGDPEGPDRMCSLGAVRLERDQDGWRAVEERSWLCDPHRGVNPGAAAVNRFCRTPDGSVPDGFQSLAGELDAWLAVLELDLFRAGSPLGFHNETFDVGVLDAERDLAGMERSGMPILCTKKAFSDIQGLGRPDRYVKGTNLNALCDLLGISRQGRTDAQGAERHGALEDAMLAARCFAVLEPLGWIKVDDPADLPHRLLPRLPARAPEGAV